MRRFLTILTFILFALATNQAKGQHVLAITGGSGMATARLYPAQETQPIWGACAGGVSWRYYSLPRWVGGIGVDLEWMQRGFSYAPYASIYEDKKDYKYYRRNVNSIMMPLVWQPHFYLFKKHLRVYLEAAPTFSFNFSSKFRNDERFAININGLVPAPIEGKYEFRSERDNRFSYGLRGGAGLDLIFGQLEVGVRAMYDFGYSDILRNRNKYYGNNLDSETKPGENPFYYTPLRSPLDNLTISVKVGFRIGKAGFKEWEWKRPAFPKNKEVFKYTF